MFREKKRNKTHTFNFTFLKIKNQLSRGLLLNNENYFVYCEKVAWIFHCCFTVLMTFALMKQFLEKWGGGTNIKDLCFVLEDLLIGVFVVVILFCDILSSWFYPFACVVCCPFSEQMLLGMRERKTPAIRSNWVSCFADCRGGETQYLPWPPARIHSKKDVCINKLCKSLKTKTKKHLPSQAFICIYLFS